MGILARIAAGLSGRAKSQAAELARMLPAGDRLLAHCQVVPGARSHDGADGFAASLPRADVPRIMAVTEAGLPLWDFGGPGHERLPPTLERGIARAEVVSFADTGETACDGVPVARITFRDRSYVDYRLTGRPGKRFWAAVATFEA